MVYSSFLLFLSKRRMNFAISVILKIEKLIFYLTTTTHSIFFDLMFMYFMDG